MRQKVGRRESAMYKPFGSFNTPTLNSGSKTAGLRSISNKPADFSTRNKSSYMQATKGWAKRVEEKNKK